MAGANGELVTQGYQLRYMNTIKRANDQSKDWPLLRYSQKDSSPNKEASTFYKFGRLASTAYTEGDNYNSGTGAFDVIGGYNGAELLQSIKVTPTPERCPVWIGEDEFDKSSLDINSPLVEAQMTAMYKGGNIKILTKIKAFVAGTYTRSDKDGNSAAVTLPTKNAFGDPAVAFETAANIKAFRKAAVSLKSMANGRPYCWLTGIDGESDMVSSDRFTNKDWVTVSSSDGVDISKLLGGEVIGLREFDGVFYPLGTETEAFIIGIAKDAIGFSARKEKIRSVIKHIEEREAVYYNTKSLWQLI